MLSESAAAAEAEEWQTRVLIRYGNGSIGSGREEGDGDENFTADAGGAQRDTLEGKIDDDEHTLLTGERVYCEISQDPSSLTQRRDRHKTGEPGR